MSAPARAAALLGTAWLLMTGTLPGATAQEVVDPGPPGQPWIAVTRLGPVQVEDERRISLAEATADLTCEVWNAGPDDELVILLRPVGRQDWTVAATAVSEPGGLCQIAGVRFPDAGNYELVAGLFAPGDLPALSPMTGKVWGPRARAVSRRLAVRVAAPPPDLESERPDLAILSVGGVAVAPRDGVTPVPARGEVEVQAPKLPPGSRIYLAELVPHSDRGYLHGPARSGSRPGRYVLQGVSLDVPGDPRQGHLELIAVVSPDPLAAGPFSLRTFRRRDLSTSPMVEVVVDERWPAGNGQRVPWVAITRIGRQEIDPARPPEAPVPAGPGDLIEVGRSERVPEGTSLWLLTRLRGSVLWRVQGPAMLRGSPAGDVVRDGAPEPAWVWPGLRFEHPESKREEAGGDGEFEVLAVLSMSGLPGSWIDSASLARGFVLTVSPLVTVRATPAPPLTRPEVAIRRVGGAKVHPGSETAVGAVEPVEVESRQELPPSWRVYLARHPIGSTLWTLTEAMPQGRSHVVPAVSFINPHVEEGARYQVVAIVTPGTLPAEELEYEDLVHAAVASSPVVTVRYERKGIAGWISRLSREVSAPLSTAPAQRRTSMSWIWILLALLLGGMALLALLIFSEWRWRLVSPIAHGAANRVQHGLVLTDGWVIPPRRIDPAGFLLGLGLLVLMIWAIARQYLPLYGEAVAVVTGLEAEKSAGLAFLLVLLTGLAGVLLELTSGSAVLGEGRQVVRIVLCVFLSLGLLVLMSFEGLFYYTFLRKTAGGLVPALGGIAFFLIAFVEAIAFFFITRLTLAPAGAMTVRLLRAPVVITGLTLRLFERFFDSLPKRRKRKKEEEEKGKPAEAEESSKEEETP